MNEDEETVETREKFKAGGVLRGALEQERERRNEMADYMSKVLYGKSLTEMREGARRAKRRAKLRHALWYTTATLGAVLTAGGFSYTAYLIGEAWLMSTPLHALGVTAAGTFPWLAVALFVLVCRGR